MKLYIQSISFLLLLFAGTFCKAQSRFQEYLLSINPADGSYSYINTIPGVNTIIVGPSGTVIDDVNNRFIFTGIDTANQMHLYTLDAATGNVIYKPVITVIGNTDNFGELVFDDSLQTIYGLYWKSDVQTEYFISVNQSTGVFILLDSLQGVKYISPGAYTYNQNHHQYFFEGSDLLGNNYLYTVQVPTGHILQQPLVLATAFNSIRYDNTTNTLYGNEIGYLLKVNPVNGDTTIIKAVPAITGVYSLPNYTTFDEVHQRYTLGSSSNTPGLYTLDTLGNVVYNPQFPLGLDSGENIIELNYNNKTGILYGLHWGYGPDGINNINASYNQLRYYPNPFTDIITFYLPQAFNHSVINIYNTIGKLVRKEEAANVLAITINRCGLADGNYFFEAIGNSERIATGTVVIK